MVGAPGCVQRCSMADSPELMHNPCALQLQPMLHNSSMDVLCRSDASRLAKELPALLAPRHHQGAAAFGRRPLKTGTQPGCVVLVQLAAGPGAVPVSVAQQQRLQGTFSDSRQPALQPLSPCCWQLGIRRCMVDGEQTCVHGDASLQRQMGGKSQKAALIPSSPGIPPVDHWWGHGPAGRGAPKFVCSKALHSSKLVPMPLLLGAALQQIGRNRKLTTKTEAAVGSKRAP